MIDDPPVCILMAVNKKTARERAVASDAA